MAIQTMTSETMMDTLRPVVVATGEETVSTGPAPSGGEPTAKAQAEIDKAKAGTDPAIQKRIDKITSEKKEMEEAFESEYIARIAAEQKLRDALKDKETTTAVVVAPVVEELKRPRLQDFKTAEEYDTALDSYDVKKSERDKTAARQEALQQIEFERRKSAMKAKVDEALQVYPDFQQTMTDFAAAGITVPAPCQAFMEESDQTAAMAYYLAKHPDERSRIFGYSSFRAVAELGKLETKLQAERKDDPTPPEKEEGKTTTTPPIRTTRAPAPIPAVRTESGTVQETDLSTADFGNYKAVRLAQLRSKKH